MATTGKNHSDLSQLPDGSGFSIGIVTAEWNIEITGSLLKGCEDTLLAAGVSEQNIRMIKVPGSFELTTGAQMILENMDVDAVVCLGCVIQGETKHDDYISNAVANGVTNLSIQYAIPVIFGLVTTNNRQQAEDRAGGVHGNKGVEAAVTALRMAVLQQRLEAEKTEI